MVLGALKDNEMSQRMGRATHTSTTKSATPQATFFLVVADAAVAIYRPTSEPGAAVPNPRMKRTAMMATAMKMSTEMADPIPRLRAVKRLS